MIATLHHCSVKKKSLVTDNHDLFIILLWDDNVVATNISYRLPFKNISYRMFQMFSVKN